MRVLCACNLLFLYLFSVTVAQTKLPRHDSAALIQQSDLIIIGRVQGRSYIADESIKENFDTEKYKGELVELVAEESLLNHVNHEERLLAQGISSMRLQVYVPGHPFGTDREVLFIPNETYLVFLKRYTVEPGKTSPLVMWNRSLKRWEKFPEPSAIYFMVVDGGNGLVPQKDRYQDFIQETKRLCYELRSGR
jgi:hypothetical protein